MWWVYIYVLIVLDLHGWSVSSDTMVHWKKRQTQSNNTSKPSINQTDSETGTIADDTSTCIRGVKVGTTIIDTPNRTSILTVGGHALIKWHYTDTVSSKPKFLDIKLQLIQDGVGFTWDKYVVQNLNLSQGASAYNWTIQPLNDGQYKLRFVPDGKETFNVEGDKMPCFADGESLV